MSVAWLIVLLPLLGALGQLLGGSSLPRRGEPLAVSTVVLAALAALALAAPLLVGVAGRDPPAWAADVTTSPAALFGATPDGRALPAPTASAGDRPRLAPELRRELRRALGRRDRDRDGALTTTELGSAGRAADADGDGRVGPDELLAWRADVGASAWLLAGDPLPAAAPVPAARSALALRLDPLARIVLALAAAAGALALAGGAARRRGGRGRPARAGAGAAVVGLLLGAAAAADLLLGAALLVLGAGLLRTWEGAASSRVACALGAALPGLALLGGGGSWLLTDLTAADLPAGDRAAGAGLVLAALALLAAPRPRASADGPAAALEAGVLLPVAALLLARTAPLLPPAGLAALSWLGLVGALAAATGAARSGRLDEGLAWIHAALLGALLLACGRGASEAAVVRVAALAPALAGLRLVAGSLAGERRVLRRSRAAGAALVAGALALGGLPPLGVGWILELAGSSVLTAGALLLVGLLAFALTRLSVEALRSGRPDAAPRALEVGAPAVALVGLTFLPGLLLVATDPTTGPAGPPTRWGLPLAVAPVLGGAALAVVAALRPAGRRRRTVAFEAVAPTRGLGDLLAGLGAACSRLDAQLERSGAAAARAVGRGARRSRPKPEVTCSRGHGLLVDAVGLVGVVVVLAAVGGALSV